MSPIVRPKHEDISDKMWDKVDEIIEKYRNFTGGITQALREAQEVVGYLPIPLINYIADRMNISRSDAFGVASFYALFSLKPKGRHLIRVCLGTACYVKGIKDVLTRIHQEYGLEVGDTTEDRRFSLEGVRCLGACGFAPVMVVDGKTYGTVTADKVIEILENYK